MAAGVALMLGGNPQVCGIAFLAAASIDRLQKYIATFRLPMFYLQVAGVALATSFAVGADVADINVDPPMVVPANLLLLPPGIGFLVGHPVPMTVFRVTAVARMHASLSTP